MLLRRLLIIGLLLALAFAAIATWAIERVRTADRALALERVALSHQTDLIRARCESNPKWFLAGPRENAPSAALMADPDADVLAPRPDANPRPVEFFAYDVEMIGQSTAAPRLPPSLRNRLRRTETLVTEAFTTEAGTGVQTVLTTLWDGPCAFLLFRMHPPPAQGRQRATIFGAFTLGAFAVAMLLAWPVERRIRKIGAQMRESARTEYRDPAAVRGRDELSQLGFAFNEAALDINRLHTDFRDRDTDSRRLLSYLASDAEAVFQSTLVEPDPARATADVLRLSNIVVGAHLRDAGAKPTTRIDVGSVVAAVTREFDRYASARGVGLERQVIDHGVALEGDPVLLPQAVRNLIAFAVDREPRGGRVTVALRRGSAGGFSLLVSDTGPNLPDEDLRKLNAVRRFRGDEGRGAELRGDIGLGLAIVHEICHRFQLGLTFSRPVSGGLQIEVAPATIAR